MKRNWHPRWFIAGFIALALVVMGIRLENLADVLSGGDLAHIPSATAEDHPAEEEKKAPEKAAEKPTEKTSEKSEEKAADKSAEKEASSEGAKAQTAHTPPPDDLSAGELEVLKQLSNRRSLLDQREQELIQKTAILQAAELRVEQKVRDMEKLRSQIKGMLGQLSEEQQTQIDNLVKMYELMKPKEAARIMQTLDIDVLLRVLRQMKPAKSAPILAEMDAPKAKEITMSLAAQHELPDTRAIGGNAPKPPSVPPATQPIPPPPSPANLPAANPPNASLPQTPPPAAVADKKH